jgi:hypothetical protein
MAEATLRGDRPERPAIEVMVHIDASTLTDVDAGDDSEPEALREGPGSLRGPGDSAGRGGFGTFSELTASRMGIFGAAVHPARGERAAGSCRGQGGRAGADGFGRFAIQVDPDGCGDAERGRRGPSSVGAASVTRHSAQAQVTPISGDSAWKRHPTAAS